MGAKVNGRLVPLESTLTSGDVVEVFTSKNPDSGPSQDWLSFVKSLRARATRSGSGSPRSGATRLSSRGRDAIARAMRKQNMPLQKLMSQDSFSEVAAQMNYVDMTRRSMPPSARATYPPSRCSRRSSQLVHADTGGRGSTEFSIPTKGSTQTLRDSDSGVLVRGAPDILVKLARCCTPVSRATRSSGSSRAGRAFPCTRPPVTMSSAS